MLITAEVHWRFINNVVTPAMAALGKSDEEMKEKIKNEELVSVNKHLNKVYLIVGNARRIFGEK